METVDGQRPELPTEVLRRNSGDLKDNYQVLPRGTWREVHGDTSP